MSYITRDVFIHQIDNPLAPDLDTKIQLGLLNSDKLALKFLETSKHKTRYQLTISDYIQLGLQNTDQVSVETFFNRILLSFNLVLKRPVITVYDVIYSTIQLSSESVRAIVGFNEQIDEKKILEYYTLITKMENNPSQDLRINNLQKSLSTYQNAVESNLKLLIFKDLYASLELATNSDGNSRENTELDAEIANLSSIDQTTAMEWRRLYNRIKHVNRNSSDMNTLSQGIQNLNDKIKNIRFTSQEVILSRLRNI